MNVFLRTIIIIIFLAFYSCKDNIDNPVEKTQHLYKVEGFITHKGLPVPSAEITLDTLFSVSDSTGYFLFDSVKSGQSRIIIVHPQFTTIDSLINIDRDVTLSFDMQYHLYKVEGLITHNGLPVPSAEVTLDTLFCVSDSSGYFSFDSLRSGQSGITIVHPRYITVDTLININRDITFSFDLQYRSESFLPLKIGNKWYYNSGLYGTSNQLVIEVEGIEEIDGLSYYKLSLTQTSNNLTHYWFVRIENDSLYRYLCDEAGLLAPFNNEVDSSFYIHSCSIDYIATLYQKSEDELKFRYIAILVLDADFGFVFQKGIGITSYYSGGWYYFVLDHYEINSQVNNKIMP